MLLQEIIIKSRVTFSTFPSFYPKSPEQGIVKTGIWGIVSLAY